MKSKISFFNKTIFFKNITLYWPIWGIYTFVLMCMVPVNLWVNYNDNYRINPLTDVNKLEYLLSSIALQPYVLIIAAMAIFTGIAIYHYLYNSRSANMIHALPVDRRELFGTNVITGIVFLVVPQILTFVAGVLVCLASGSTRVEYLFYWLVVCAVTSVIAFSIVTFCAYITGHAVAMPVYVGVMNFLVYAVWGIMVLMVNIFAYGVSSDSLLGDAIIRWFSPIVCFWSNLTWVREYSTKLPTELIGASLDGIEYIAVYSVVAICLYVAAYFIYKKRHIESAGEFVAVPQLRPIFRFGVGTFGGLIFAIFVRGFFSDFGVVVEGIGFFLVLLLCAAICYFAADMLIHKSFRVFKKANWKRFSYFIVLFFTTFGLLFFYTKLEEKRVPEAEEVDIAYINMGISAIYDDSVGIENLIAVHEEIVEHIDYYSDAYAKRNSGWQNKKYEYVEIAYILKDGTRFQRSYRIPYEEYGKSVIETIAKWEEDPHHFLSALLCSKYDEVTEFEYGNIRLLVKDVISEEKDTKGDDIEISKNGCYYKEIVLEDKKILEMIYDAVIADAKAGDLMKYNSSYLNWYSDKEDYIVKESSDLNIRFKIPKGAVVTNDFWRTYHSGSARAVDPYYYDGEYKAFNISFGVECENIMKALVESGAISEETAKNVVN